MQDQQNTQPELLPETTQKIVADITSTTDQMQSRYWQDMEASLRKIIKYAEEQLALIEKSGINPLVARDILGEEAQKVYVASQLLMQTFTYGNVVRYHERHQQ